MEEEVIFEVGPDAVGGVLVGLVGEVGISAAATVEENFFGDSGGGFRGSEAAPLSGALEGGEAMLNN